MDTTVEMEGDKPSETTEMDGQSPSIHSNEPLEDAKNPSESMKEPMEEAAEEDVEDQIEDPSIIHVDASILSPWNGEKLPYELGSLEWDKSHTTNKQNTYCYCGNPKTQWTPMYRCSSCRQFYHLECLASKPLHPTLKGDANYKFKCGLCNKEGEQFEQLAKSWSDIVRIAIYNLVLAEKKKGGPKRFFQYKEEICSYIDKNWEHLCFGKTRTKTWENTIGSALSTKSHYFRSGGEALGAPGFWGLKSETDPSTFKADGPAVKTKSNGPAPSSSKKIVKQGSVGGAPKKRNRSELLGLDEKTKQRKPKSVPLPIYLPKATYEPHFYGYKTMCLAKENSAPQVKIQSDLLTMSNEKGYRLSRASFGASEGTWYYEVDILPHSGNSRIGWATEKGDAQAPVGYDKYSYSYRDKEGTKFHQSRGRGYGDSYTDGDTVGCYINLPPKPPKEASVEVKKEENLNPPPTTSSKKDEEEPNPLSGSQIIFFKNGVSQGVAFADINEGTYYPAASCYKGGTIRFNFGPNFKYPPKDITFMPISELPPLVPPPKAEEKTEEKPIDAMEIDQTSASQPPVEGESLKMEESNSQAAPFETNNSNADQEAAPSSVSEGSSETQKESESNNNASIQPPPLETLPTTQDQSTEGVSQ